MSDYIDHVNWYEKKYLNLGQIAPWVENSGQCENGVWAAAYVAIFPTSEETSLSSCCLEFINKMFYTLNCELK